MSIYNISQLFCWHWWCLGLIIITLLISFPEFPITGPFVVVKWCLDCSISSQVTTPITGQDLSSALIPALESNTVSPVSVPNNITFNICSQRTILSTKSWQSKFLRSMVILLRLKRTLACLWMHLKVGWLRINLSISFWCGDLSLFCISCWDACLF